jgi:hypothetical protein
MQLKAEGRLGGGGELRRVLASGGLCPGAKNQGSTMPNRGRTGSPTAVQASYGGLRQVTANYSEQKILYAKPAVGPERHNSLGNRRPRKSKRVRPGQTRSDSKKILMRCFIVETTTAGRPWNRRPQGKKLQISQNVDTNGHEWTR